MGKTANIMFTGGVVHTPSDLSPRDGDLNECINLVPSDGELKPIEMPEKVMSDASNQLQLEGTLAAVHEGTWGKNYVSVSTDAAVRFYNSNGVKIFYHFFSSYIRWVKCVGNIVMIGTDNGIQYFRYLNASYKPLGGNPPFPKIHFSIEEDDEIINIKSPLCNGYNKDGSSYDKGVPLIYYNQDVYVQTYHLWNEGSANKDLVRDNIKSKISKALNDVSEKGTFVFPFLVRYALRMYDNSYTWISDPILIMPSDYRCPLFVHMNILERTSEERVAWDNVGQGYKATGNPNICVQPFRLRMRLYGYEDTNYEEALKNWEGIVKSVDLFVSRPFYSYNEKLFDDIAHNRMIDYYQLGENGSVEFGYSYKDNGKTDIKTYFNNIKSDFNYANSVRPHLILPIADKKTMAEKIESESIFYKVKSFSFEEINSMNNKDVVVDLGDVLVNLETKTALTEEEFSRFRKSAYVSELYNNRVDIANISLKLPRHYNILSDSNTEYNFDLSLTFPDEQQARDSGIYFFLKKTEGEIVYHVPRQYVNKFTYGQYVFFPDADCYKVFFAYGRTFGRSFKMKQHTGLDGSVYFNKDFQPLYENRDYDDNLDPNHLPVPYDNDASIKKQNLIMVSAVSNPFLFPTLNMIEVGTRQILGLSTYALPLSQGQFGQYPVVVFSEDGIRSLGINGDGTIGSVAPVSTADVLTGFAKPGRPNVISDGQSLYFITRRGIMRMSGLSVQCISDVLDGRRWVASDYAGITNTNEGPNEIRTAVRNLIAGVADYRTFDAMLAGGDAWLAFDYRNGRIIVTDPEQPAPYVYSIRYNQWSRMLLNRGTWNDNFFPITDVTQRAVPVKFQSSVFNCTESYMQDGGGGLWDLMGSPDENVDGGYKFGFLMSRPIRFGTDDYKTLERVIHRRRIDSPFGKIGMRLYGSADGIVWHEIRSFRGAAFKYYSVGVYTCMKANERYAYMSAEFTEKHTDKLR